MTGKVNAQEVNEVRHIVWAPRYRLNLFNNYCMRQRFFPLMGSVALGAILAAWITNRFQADARIVGLIFCSIGVACLSWLLVRYHRIPPKLLAKINEDQPQSIEFEYDGLTLRQENGIRTTLPWSVLKGWRAGSCVAVIDFVQGGNMLVVPIDLLSEDEKTDIRARLTQRLGDPAFELPTDK